MVTLRQIIISLGLFSLNSVAVSATLEECSNLLPEGHEYKIEITLDVDKTSSDTSTSGNFSVTGGADQPSSFDISAFVECAAPLIKNVEDENPQT
ncbi:hypothetical protein L4C33_19565 [Vibrio makurazakiensis]|uniref:hypothetical protein n=1 Tax=Vibrio makurazakiensis TaxID=2910250 RepID=UPI003D13370B